MNRLRLSALARACAVLLAVAAMSGCVHRLVEIPFDVARHAVVESAALPIDMAEIATKGVIDAMIK